MELFQVKDFVRHVVATIHNIPREKLAQRLRPVKPAGGKFIVTGKDDSLAIGAGNAAQQQRVICKSSIRLTPINGPLLDMHFYPLFQQAYQELGIRRGILMIAWLRWLIICWRPLKCRNR